MCPFTILLNFEIISCLFFSKQDRQVPAGANYFSKISIKSDKFTDFLAKCDSYKRLTNLFISLECLPYRHLPYAVPEP